MKTNNETEKNVYVQPECKVIQVEMQQMIASSTERLDEESFPWSR